MKKLFCIFAVLCCFHSGVSRADLLHEAIEGGDLAAVRQLLEAGEDVNATNDANDSPLQIAARHGRGEIARLLIEKGADINGDDSGSGSALRLAAIGGHFDVIELLLDHGAESADTMEAATLLVHAVSQGDLALINKLISRKIDLDAEPLYPEPYDHSENALYTAINLNRPDIIQLLVQNGASIRAEDMIRVVCTKNLHLVRLFVEQGAKVENVVLARTLECGNREELAYLMSNAGKLDYRGILQSIPGYYYAGEGPPGISKELFEVLFAGDAELASHAAPALRNALVTGNHEFLKFLLGKGVSLPQGEGEGDLLYAARNGHVEIVDILLKRDIEVDTRSEWGNTPLLLAVPYNQTRVAALLLQNGANVNAKNELFNTPLHMAAARGLVEMASLLIEQGARVNAINGDGNTPLHQVARFSRFEVLTLLLSKKANVNLQNKRGMSALHYLAARNTEYRDYDEVPGGQRYYADPDGLAYYQRPDLQQVSDKECVGAIGILLGAGADPNIRNLRGESALDIARAHSKNPDVIRLLAERSGGVKP